MNNDFFRRLVNGDESSSKNDGSKGKGSKTTKEIAREVVEQEFKERKRKRGRDEDYLSDDDDDYDDDRGDSRKQDKKREKEEADAMAEAEEIAKEKKNKNKKPKYRNRAKERRDGKFNVDYQDSTGMVNHLDEEMSKYLGGDEAHTHLVKGLDKTLADKVRREAMGQREEPTIATAPTEDDLDLDQIMEEASSAKAREAHKAKLDKVPKGIKELVPKNSTALSRGMLSYLKKLERQQRQSPGKGILSIDDHTGTISQAGDTLSRTTFKFSLDANVRDRFKSWELPEETLISSIQHEERMHSRSTTKTCTPLDRHLIEKIKAVFSGLKKKENNKNPKNSGLKLEKQGSYVEVKKVINQDPIRNGSDKKTILEDSDDDIFGDIGDYIPPKKGS